MPAVPLPPPKLSRSAWQRLGAHVRDGFIGMFPIESRTAAGWILRIHNRSELALYRSIFVQRLYPLDTYSGTVAGTETPVVYDVGANSGHFAASVFDRWPAARVCSFEPQRDLARRIVQFAAANGLADRLEVVPAAVARTAGTGSFYRNRDPISASLLRAKVARRAIRRVDQVPIVSLDEFAASRDNPRVDILKIDAEGSELDVLEGGTAVLRHVRLLFVEVHPPFSRFVDIARMLSPLGLRCANPATPPEPDRQTDCVFVRSGAPASA